MISSIKDYLAKHGYLLLIGLIILTVVTLALTLVPARMLESTTIWNFDKIGHFLMFGAWTYLLGLYFYFSPSQQFNLLTIFILGVGFGVAVELLQYSMPFQRHADFFDIAFDSLGSFAAIITLKKTMPDISSES